MSRDAGCYGASVGDGEGEAGRNSQLIGSPEIQHLIISTHIRAAVRSATEKH